MHMHHHNTGGIAIDSYACNSRLRHISAGFKAGFSMLLLLFCIFADHPVISVLLILFAASVTVFLGGIPLHDYFFVLGIPVFFVLLGGIAIAVDFSLQPTGDFYLNLFFCYLCVTYAGILKAFFLMLKVFGAVSCMFLMTLSTPSHELFSVLHKIHCPSLFTELMHMIYRYIFILLEVQHNMQISAEARLGFCDFRTSCYSFGQIAANLFIVALKKANAYYDAMEARCYDGTLCFLEEKKKLPLPYIIASGTFFLFLVVLWLFIR